MGGVYDSLPTVEADTLRSILIKRRPVLAARMEDEDVVTMNEREEVEDALADELMSQMSAPNWEPTPYGLQIEAVIDAFLARYPIERQ